MYAEAQSLQQVRTEEVTCSNCRNSRGGRLARNVRRGVELLLCTERNASLLVGGCAAVLTCSDVPIQMTAGQKRVMAAVRSRRSI